MLKTVRIATLSILAIQSLTACKMVKNLDEMHAATVALDGKTDKLVAGTGAVDEKTDQQRQAVAAKTREDALISLEKPATLKAKFDAAAKYMYALEFQSWRGQGMDTEERREAMYVQAVEEFFNTIDKMIQGDYDTSPTSENNDRMSLYALAGALHRLNPEQELMAKRMRFKPKSMLDVIEDGLATINDVNKGERSMDSLKDYQIRVQRNGRAARFIIQLRANVLAASPIKSITNLDDSTGFWDTIGLGGVAKLFRKGSKLISNWTADYAIDLAELEYQNDKLDYALKSRKFMRDHGIPFQANSSVVKIYKNMREGDQEIMDDHKDGEKTVIDRMSAAQLDSMKSFQAKIDQWINFKDSPKNN